MQRGREGVAAHAPFRVDSIARGRREGTVPDTCAALVIAFVVGGENANECSCDGVLNRAGGRG